MAAKSSPSTRRVWWPVFVAILVTATGCIPNFRADRTHWAVTFSDQATTGIPSVVLLGDSLVTKTSGISSAQMAFALTMATGRGATVEAASGIATAHFIQPALLHKSPTGFPWISPDGSFLEHQLFTVQQHVQAKRPELLILAVGSNDARIIFEEEIAAQNDPALDIVKYRLADYSQVLDLAVAETQAASPASCVLLVNVAIHGSDPFNEQANHINNLMWTKAWSVPGVVLADWQAHSQPHPDWFVSPTDYHHTPAGEAAYLDFITTHAAAALNDCS